jgi:hypothetical protein
MSLSPPASLTPPPTHPCLCHSLCLLSPPSCLPPQVTRKNFKFAAKNNLPFFFVSAADGTNVVKVFQTAIIEARRFKSGGGDLLSDMLELLGDSVSPPFSSPLPPSPGDRNLKTKATKSSTRSDRRAVLCGAGPGRRGRRAKVVCVC